MHHSYIIVLLFALLCSTSCNSEPKEVTTVEVIEPKIKPVDVSEIEVTTPNNVINQEKVINGEYINKQIMYFNHEEEVPEQGKSAHQLAQNFAVSHNIGFHSLFAEDKKGMIPLENNQFFDISNFLLESTSGFVLIKKQKVLFIDAVASAEATQKNISSFFSEKN